MVLGLLAKVRYARGVRVNSLSCYRGEHDGVCICSQGYLHSAIAPCPFRLRLRRFLLFSRLWKAAMVIWRGFEDFLIQFDFQQKGYAGRSGNLFKRE